MNDFIEIRKVIHIIWRRLWLLILISLLSAVLGYAISQWQSPVYEATTTFMAVQSNQTNLLDKTEPLTTEELARIYVYTALRQPVLQGVTNALNLPGTWRELKPQIRANVVEGTPLIQITAKAHSTELARDIANEVVRQLNLLDSSLRSNTVNTEQEVLPNSLRVIETAHANPQPIQPRTTLNIILAGVVGLLLALGLLLLLEFRDDTVKEADDVSRSLGLAPLGTVNSIGGKHEQDRVLTSQGITSPIMEAYRIIRSNIEFKTAVQPGQSILVTSPGTGEGKSTVAANLGIIMADAGYRTIIVDADLRQPAQHRLFQIPNSIGLAEAIRSPELDLGRLLIDTKVPYLQVLPSGRLPANPARLLGSHGMRQILADLSQMADVLIYDSPPVLGLTDTSLIANRVDSVVMIMKIGQTRREMARQAVVNLQQARASIIGVIFNQGRSKHLDYYKPELRTTTGQAAAKSAYGRTD